MSILVEQTIEKRLANIESRLDQLLDGKEQRESYSVEQFAERVGLDPWTIREYCRHGRIQASKKRSGRGRDPALGQSATSSCAATRSVKDCFLSENRTDSSLLDRRVQVGIASALLLRRVPDPGIDQPLIGAFHHARGNKAVTQHMVASHHFPRTLLQHAAEVMMRLDGVSGAGFECPCGYGPYVPIGKTTNFRRDGSPANP